MKQSFFPKMPATLHTLPLISSAAAFLHAQTIPPKVAKSSTDGRASSETRPKAPASVSQRLEKEGIRVDFTLAARPDDSGRGGELVAEADAAAIFRVTDARTGQPVTGLSPSA